MQTQTIPSLQGLSTDRAHDWMRQIPSEKVPKLETDGEKYRELQLVYQLPKQDMSIKYCHHVDNGQMTSFQEFVNARNEIALDVGHPVDSAKERTRCYKCKKTIVAGGLAVSTLRQVIDTKRERETLALSGHGTKIRTSHLLASGLLLVFHLW